jgi:hypothetical protein
MWDIIDGVGGSYQLDYTQYGSGREWMSAFRIVPDPKKPGPQLSQEGDSGSLWIDGSGAPALGLHFAGEDNGSPLNEYALAHPVQEVLSRFNVALSGGQQG